MKVTNRIRTEYSLIFAAGFLGLVLSTLFAITARAQGSTDAAKIVASKANFSSASIQARPGLECKLYTSGSAPSSGLTIFTDDDGYARFHALKLSADHAKREHVLDCADTTGKRSTYPVDFASDDIFTPRPINLAKERGKDRPPLIGDPFRYTQLQLIQAGYGLRPDPASDPSAYLTWLMAASMPGRFLHAKRPDYRAHNPITVQSPYWVGSVEGGAPNYIAVQGIFNVPTAIPGGDQTTNTVISIWNGLGGFGSGSGLIQSGVTLQTTPTAAGYGSWREYCCGDPNSNGYGGAFVPSPGDIIFAQNWYCDANGTPNLNGGYGCSFLQDLTSTAILSCTSANGSPCWSVKALPLCSVSPQTPNCMTVGLSAEFIIEHQSDQLTPPVIGFTDFVPTVRMQGSAYSSVTNRYSQTISTDPTVFLLTDFTNVTTGINVVLGPRDVTCFTIYQKPNPPPAVDCSFPPFPPPSLVERSRRDEIVALILRGVIQGGGGWVIIGGKLKRIPPSGPVTEILAVLPPALAQRMAPLLKEYPANSESALRLMAQLNIELTNFQKEQLSRQRQH